LRITGAYRWAVNAGFFPAMADAPGAVSAEPSYA
jgi:hypothetical protein